MKKMSRLLKIDFELISFKTEIIYHNEDVARELEIVDTVSEEVWLNPDITIRQNYEIFTSSSSRS